MMETDIGVVRYAHDPGSENDMMLQDVLMTFRYTIVSAAPNVLPPETVRLHKSFKPDELKDTLCNLLK